jgi:hypothetical protein
LTDFAEDIDAEILRLRVIPYARGPGADPLVPQAQSSKNQHGHSDQSK